MTLTGILAFGAAALLLGLAPESPRWLRVRSWGILAANVAALFMLQPAAPIRYLDFWFPAASLALSALGWAVSRPKGAAVGREPVYTGLAVGGMVLLMTLPRYLGDYAPGLCCLTATRPPQILPVAAVVLVSAGVVLGTLRLGSGRKGWLWAVFGLVLLLFVVLKSAPLSVLVSTWLRELGNQSTTLAKASDLRWLGFSYIAFRILHTVRDRQNGRFAALSLREYISYVTFFPALTAGPIDRAERFNKDLQKPVGDTASRLAEGGARIAVGLLKKFAVADTLALIALSESNYAQVTSTGWMWLLLYAYALRIYFDFSGYTDIAIGLGRLLGIRLPENFDRPYLKPNLTLFWNSWHMTLAQWFRSYFFNPLTRALRTLPKPLPTSVIILLGQASTMILIGLWHGVTWNFLIWGAWHGLGLFLHSRWLELYRARFSQVVLPAGLQRGLTWLGTFLTFNYVAIGWAWFALPQTSQSWTVLLKLFGWS
jgi:D-alanyl-lipoteichoic acid acyltransferase DltB (MBOAT superfamily)